VKRNIYIENKPLEDARELFASRLEACGYFEPKAEEIPTLEAYNRISASAIYARRSAPHYVASAMDGIAVAAVETESANDYSPLTLSSDQYLEVDTGDYVPPQFDSVIMIEEVNLTEEGARIIKPAVPWQHIRSIGEDLVARDMIVPSGIKLGPYEIASLLTAAIERVAVVKNL
jgi:molybdopterin molybdochelatase